MRSLTERQAGLLNELRRAGFRDDEWFRPMDVGGRDGSEHSNILRELCAKGFVERKRRNTSSSYLYRLTAIGRGGSA
jgi:hypothetical protein